jgi:predicted hydrolase (HD superfamily)
MLSLPDAHNLIRHHLGDSSRAKHSAFVGFAMRRLAQRLGSDEVLSEVVGLCHDLDYEDTRTEPARHGLTTAKWLKGELPFDALQAIEAHDHRTRVMSETPIADCLKLADALAIIVEKLGERAAAVLASADAEPTLLREFADRAYLPSMVLAISRKRRLPLAVLAEICSSAPPH